MSEIQQRYEKVADQFTQRAEAVPPGAWASPTPCDGWLARDVVRHLVSWIPGFFESYAGVSLATGPSVDDDPVGAWKALDHSIRAALDDPATCARAFEVRGARHRFDDAVATFCIGDILVHTWDLARATGLDETLDPAEVRTALAGMAPVEEAMRQSGQYGPRVEVPPDADEQTRLIAFSGRQP